MPRVASAAARTRAGRGLALAVLLLAGSASALQGEPAVVYPVSRFEVEYALGHPRQLPIEEVLDLEVGLSSQGLAYVAPRPVDRTVRMRLSSIPEGASFSATAIQHITRYVVSHFNRRGVNGVIVTVPDIDDATGADLRPPGRTVLRLRIWLGRVSRLASIGDGERWQGLSTEQRTNLTAHEWIRERAPVQPGGVRGLLGIKALEDYAARISRHPGRRMDVELEPGDRPGTTEVNLRIAENKPWVVYGQYSNTGTPATTKNRERFGLVHNQLTGRDDILSLDYTTGDFQDVHAVVGAYSAPFTLYAPELRFRLAGSYSQFDASEVGYVDSAFHGEQILGEAQLVYNAWQRGELFVDVFAGSRFQRMSVDNEQFQDIGGVDADETVNFWVPQAGAAVERRTRTASLLALVSLEYGLTGADEEKLEVFGTPEPDRHFLLLRWSGSHSFYLEPLLDRQAWEDPTTPETSTLAHEVALSTRGQFAFGDRLVPEFQEIAGGLYTVRGYKQATIARDNMMIATAEYRFHLPRLLRPGVDPLHVPGLGDFRLHPRSVYGQPDWDLILRVFSDAAHGFASDRLDLEDEDTETLWSVGAGIELQLLRNLNLRFDAGHTLLSAGGDDAGETRGNVLATVLY